MDVEHLRLLWLQLKGKFDALDPAINDFTIRAPKQLPYSPAFVIVLRAIGKDSELFSRLNDDATDIRSISMIQALGDSEDGGYKSVNNTSDYSLITLLVGTIILSNEEFLSRNHELLFFEFLSLMMRMETVRSFIDSPSTGTNLINAPTEELRKDLQLMRIVRRFAELPQRNNLEVSSEETRTATDSSMCSKYALPLAKEEDFRAGESRLREMRDAMEILDSLLEKQCAEESEYQRLLESAPWMLGQSYRTLIRHQKMDDDNIPDFTAVRVHDECHDLIELKQPFLKLFREDGSFSVAFSDAWHQAERYLDFCGRQRTYLLDQKDLKFENPRCILLLGHEYTNKQRDAIRAKEGMNRLITVMSYSQLRRSAEHVFQFVSALSDPYYSKQG